MRNGRPVSDPRLYSQVNAKESPPQYGRMRFPPPPNNKKFLLDDPAIVGCVPPARTMHRLPGPPPGHEGFMPFPSSPFMPLQHPPFNEFPSRFQTPPPFEPSSHHHHLNSSPMYQQHSKPFVASGDNDSNMLPPPMLRNSYSMNSSRPPPGLIHPRNAYRTSLPPQLHMMTNVKHLPPPVVMDPRFASHQNIGTSRPPMQQQAVLPPS